MLEPTSLRFVFSMSGNQKETSRSEEQALVDAMRFRPNLVVSGAEPFAEDHWNSLHIGKAHFVVS